MKILLFILFIPVLISADVICPICLKAMRESTINQMLCCGHSFHAACIGRSLRSTGLCPECRTTVGLHTDRFKLQRHDLCDSQLFGGLATLEQHAELLEIMQDDSFDMSILRILYTVFEGTIRRYPSNSDEVISIIERIREAYRERASRDVGE